MSETSFLLKVFSPGGLVFEQSVVSVVLPGADGEVGVLPQHAKYVGTLGTGIMKFETTAGNEIGRVVIAGGFVRVKGDELHILADQVVLPDEAEGVNTASEKQRLEKMIEHGDANTPEWNLARAEYLKLQAIEDLRKTE